MRVDPFGTVKQDDALSQEIPAAGRASSFKPLNEGVSLRAPTAHARWCTWVSCEAHAFDGKVRSILDNLLWPLQYVYNNMYKHLHMQYIEGNTSLLAPFLKMPSQICRCRFLHVSSMKFAVGNPAQVAFGRVLVALLCCGLLWGLGWRVFESRLRV